MRETESQPVSIADVSKYFKSKEAWIGAGVGLGLGILVMEGSLQQHIKHLRWNEIQAYRMSNLIVEVTAPLAGWFLGKTLENIRIIPLPRPRLPRWRRKAPWMLPRDKPERRIAA